MNLAIADVRRLAAALEAYLRLRLSSWATRWRHEPRRRRWRNYVGLLFGD